MPSPLADPLAEAAAPLAFCPAAVLVEKMATLEPGETKPATRPVSDRVTEMATSPSGMLSTFWSPGAPNLLVMICSPG